MHCRCCDIELNDYESTRKDLNGRYIDMCTPCFMTIKDDLTVIERDDLMVRDVVESTQPLDFDL